MRPAIFGTSALSLPPLLSISSNLQNGGTWVRINCTTVGAAVKINIIRNKDVYLNYMCNFMFGLSHCPAPESRNVSLLFAIANGASHIQFYHFLTDSPAWMDPLWTMKIYPVAAKMSKITFGIFFTTFSKCYHVLSRIPRHQFEVLRCGNHQKISRTLYVIWSSACMSPTGQPHQAISSEHFLVNLNFRHPNLTWQMRSSAAHQVHFCFGGSDILYTYPYAHKTLVFFNVLFPTTKKTRQHQ